MKFIKNKRRKLIYEISKNSKNTLRVLMALCIITTAMFSWNTEKVSAANRQLSCDTKVLNAEKMVRASEDEYGLGIISNGEVIDLSSADAISTLSLGDNKASVLGDGVRLRKAPKKTATVLELMYHNEVVLIDYIETGKKCQTGKWRYVKRIKTGTWGWAAGQYIAPWD